MDNTDSWQERAQKISNKIVPTQVEPVNLYQKETVEHLTDQLIKLQEMYNKTYMTGNYIDKTQLYKAMDSVNKALDMALCTRLVLE